MIAPKKTLKDNETGQLWLVRLVRPGDPFGLKFRLTHSDPRPMVEFYDADYDIDKDIDGTPLGQFASRYYLFTLEESKPEQGMDLHGGVPKWQVSAQLVQDAIKFARGKV